MLTFNLAFPSYRSGSSLFQFRSHANHPAPKGSLGRLGRHVHTLRNDLCYGQSREKYGLSLKLTDSRISSSRFPELSTVVAQR